MASRDVIQLTTTIQEIDRLVRDLTTQASVIRNYINNTQV